MARFSVSGLYFQAGNRPQICKFAWSPGLGNVKSAG
jgi:hypothetical protein